MGKRGFTSLQEIPEEFKEELEKYFSAIGKDTFVIHGLPPELTGGALARYSRAKTGMQLTIINEFLDEHGKPSQEKGSALMDRVLNAYGDDSVGELEGVHVGFEDVSQLLAKEIEDRRIGGSPIEQSTRYVVYDKKDESGQWRYVRPKEIMESQFAQEYVEVCDHAFEVYAELIPLLSEHFTEQFPKETFTIQVPREGNMVTVSHDQLQNESEQRAFRIAYNFTIRCAALDVGRCVLPTATKTHLGIYGNGRFFTHLLSHLKSSPLQECVQRAEHLERELNKVIPTFVKRNKKRPELQVRDQHMFALANRLLSGLTPEDGWVTLAQQSNPLDEFVASALFPYTNVSYVQLLAAVSSWEQSKKHEVLDVYVGERQTRRDRTGRAAEAGYPFTYDLIGGFGEYRDLQRHRMLTQQRQLLSVDLGFIMPPEITTVGMHEQVSALVERVDDVNRRLRQAGLVYASQYMTLFNHRIRWMMGMNARALQHLTELRSGINGHHSYRSMAMQMAKEAIAREPWMASLLNHVDYSDPDNKIARAKEQSRIQGKNLKSGVDASVDLD